MKKGCIYYTDGHVSESIRMVCQRQLRFAFDGEIVSCSLEPMDFGRNVVLENRVSSYPTYIAQILTALKASTADVVFFTEHDVLYHPSHFHFEPKDNVYYYNVNNWRWRWGTDTAITYEWLVSLSMMCCFRDVAIRHYELREKEIRDRGLEDLRRHEPKLARTRGYEPGMRPRRKGGITDEQHEWWSSSYPNIDIRHNQTLSRPKTTLAEFKHPPERGWREVTISEIPGWDLEGLFGA